MPKRCLFRLFERQEIGLDFLSAHMLIFKRISRLGKCGLLASVMGEILSISAGLIPLDRDL
jgi:hypothetical protein